MSETEALARGAAILKESGITDPAREARLLWRAAFPRRYTDYDDITNGQMVAHYDDLLHRRAAREPISHLLGYRDFYEHRFYIDGNALDPRPDTEALVIAALECPFKRVLDLGTGSGCILLSLLAARADATGVGTDLSVVALDVARRNCAKLELETRTELLRSDWFGDVEGWFDLIVSNPPYIAADEMVGLAPELGFEPRMALTDEGDGLSAYRAITEGAGGHLTLGGRLMVEIGWQQGEPVSTLLQEVGFDAVTVQPDLDGRDRVVSGVWPK